MDQATTETRSIVSQAWDTTYKTVSGVSMVEAIGGIATLILGIIGLTGVLPLILAACAAIAFGVVLAIQGSGIAAHYKDMTGTATASGEKTEVVGGSGAEILGGVAGGVLGLLALIGITPLILLGCTSIVFGASLLLGSASAMSVKNYLDSTSPGPHGSENLLLESAAGAEVLVGIAAVTLGILALVGIAPMTLILVALLSLGAVGMLAGSLIGGTMLSALHG